MPKLSKDQKRKKHKKKLLDKKLILESKIRAAALATAAKYVDVLELLKDPKE